MAERASFVRQTPHTPPIMADAIDDDWGRKVTRASDAQPLVHKPAPERVHATSEERETDEFLRATRGTAANHPTVVRDVFPGLDLESPMAVSVEFELDHGDDSFLDFDDQYELSGGLFDDDESLGIPESAFDGNAPRPKPASGANLTDIIAEIGVDEFRMPSGEKLPFSSSGWAGSSVPAADILALAPPPVTRVTAKSESIRTPAEPRVERAPSAQRYAMRGAAQVTPFQDAELVDVNGKDPSDD